MPKIYQLNEYKIINILIQKNKNTKTNLHKVEAKMAIRAKKKNFFNHSLISQIQAKIIIKD